MTTSTSKLTPSRFSRGNVGNTVSSAVLLATGAVAAVLPAAMQAIAAREFDLMDQGRLALALPFATLMSALAFSHIVESRLASVTGRRRVRTPYMVSILAVLACLAVVLFPGHIIVISLALPFWLAALEVGRAVCVIEGKSRREAAATVSLVLGMGLGFALSVSDLDQGFRWLSIGVAGAVISRGLVKRHAVDPPVPGSRMWIMADTLVTGSTQPVVTSFLFVVMGPQAAVIFKLLSTVSGALAPAINFLRLRLLKRHSSSDLLLAGGASLAVLLLLAAFDFFGIFSAAFGSAWDGVSVVALWVACAWRVSGLLSTPPFAALRRLGRVRLLFGLRAISAGLYTGLALGSAAFQEVAFIFFAMLVAEVLTALLFAVVARRLR